MAKGDVFRVGDKITVRLNDSRRRVGVIEQLRAPEDGRSMHYLIRFNPNATAYLTNEEMDHQDVVERLAEITDC